MEEAFTFSKTSPGPGMATGKLERFSDPLNGFQLTLAFQLCCPPKGRNLSSSVPLVSRTASCLGVASIVVERPCKRHAL